LPYKAKTSSGHAKIAWGQKRKKYAQDITIKKDQFCEIGLFYPSCLTLMKSSFVEKN
jgi:hypothetical protein